MFDKEQMSKRVNFPSYRGAIKWIKDNKETVETFIDLLNIYPDLIRHKVLDKFVNFLKAYRLQTNQTANRLLETERPTFKEDSIPTITITSDAYTRKDGKENVKLLIVGNAMFGDDESNCEEFITALNRYFTVHCHDFAVSNGYIEASCCDACIFLLSNSCMENAEYFSLFQHVKLSSTPVLIVKSSKISVSEQIKQSRSLSMCSVHSNDTINPISLPLPPISRTPNLLMTDHIPALNSNISLVLEMKRAAVEYNSSDIRISVLQVCHYFGVIDRENNFEQKQTRLIKQSKNLRTQETALNENELNISFTHESSPDFQFLSIADRSLSTPPCTTHLTITGTDTSIRQTQDTENPAFQDGASLIVKEHMTDCRPSKPNVKRRDQKKYELEVPKAYKSKTPPISPTLQKKNRQKINKDKVSKKDQILSLPESPIDETIFLLFSTKKDNYSTKIVNWPKDVKSMVNNDDCVSEDSSSIGFQDVDFTSSLCSYNSEDD